MEEVRPDRRIGGLQIRRLPLSSLHLDASNARSHGELNLDAIEGSLRRFGQAEPLVVQKSTGRVIGGNGRLVAMKKLGWTECDVVEVEVDDLQATALGIALNRTAELAEWDDETLARLLRELKNADGLEGVGFSMDEVDSLIHELLAGDDGAEIEDPGPGELPERPVSRLGDLWVLGGHKLLCGDSTQAEDVARLMAGEKAGLLATDPPYLVDYDGTNHPAEHHRKAGRKAAPGKDLGNKHWDEYVDPKASVEFFTAWLRAALAHCIERVPVYQWHATKRQALVEAAWDANGLLLHQTIVWVKTRGVLTRSHYLWRHEPCFYGWRKGMMPEKGRRPATDDTTIWEISQQGEQDGIHPTQKPVEIFERPIRYHTRPGDVVLECFSGSGTQIIAAEKTGRRCHAMELSPGFVDVAVKRWEGATGKAATLDADGRSFREVVRERSRSEQQDPA